MIKDLLIQHKTVIQTGSIVLAFCVLFLCENLFARRKFVYSRLLRILSNVGIAVLNNYILSISFPILAMGAAFLAKSNGWGLFNLLHWPGRAEILLCMLLMDLVIYIQHVVFHRLPWLWLLHRAHHADLELDVSSGIRFHPFEIFISMGIKIATILLLGAPPLAVFFFELLLTLSAMFNHSNIFIPENLDRILRLFVVTPDVHRVHHSVHPDETNTNFGFNFPWWDRLFGTYRAQPRDGHSEMLIGIELFRSEKWLAFHQILLIPFLDREN